MTTPQLVEFFLQIFLILLGTYAIMHEKDLIRFERKAWRYIKAFFKALFFTMKDEAEKIKNRKAGDE